MTAMVAHAVKPGGGSRTAASARPRQRLQVRCELVHLGAQALPLPGHRLDQQAGIVVAELVEHRQQQLADLAQRAVTGTVTVPPGRGPRVRQTARGQAAGRVHVRPDQRTHAGQKPTSRVMVLPRGAWPTGLKSKTLLKKPNRCTLTWNPAFSISRVASCTDMPIGSGTGTS